jgi:hypothetical protein
MPDQLPLSLLLSWAVFFCCAVGHFHHEQAIRHSELTPTKLLRAVEISQLLWLGAAVAVLVYYFVVARWYWPFVLAVGGSMLGALIAGLLFRVVGEKWVSTRGFIIWPVAAAYTIFTIHGLRS